MARSHVNALRQPHLALGLSLAPGRKLEKAARNAWIGVFLVLSFFTMAAHVYQMNKSATKGYTLREQEQRLEKLKSTVAELEDHAAKNQALYTIEERVKGLGYVPVDRMEFLDVARGSYAVAR
ncbi:hypothetical protein K8R04_01955 [Candidatus Uhrbacteria bacterium]|nr:hypothetical protein [Candidatus Uhrbacteria bacterium]